jgi:hypothetical protein
MPLLSFFKVLGVKNIMRENPNILKTQRIDSKLYQSLMTLGGESLVAVYVTLKTKRNRPEKYQAYRTGKNNKLRTHYTLLSKESGISLTTLKKYCPILEDEGLITFESNGDVTMLGNSKVKRYYSAYSSKLIPILVSNKFSETKVYVKFVLFHSAMVRQVKGHARKTEQREILSKCQTGDSFFDQRERSIIKKLMKGNPELDPNRVQLLNCLTASNLLFYVDYNSATGKERKSETQFGFRLKKQFNELGLIRSKRRFEAISPNHVSFDTFLAMKGRMVEELGYMVHWRRGLVCVELSNTIEILPSTYNSNPVKINLPYKKSMSNYFKNITVDIPNRYTINNKKEIGFVGNSEKSLTR